MDGLLTAGRRKATRSLDRQVAEVWFCRLERYEAQAGHLARLLSIDECRRMERFAFDRDRKRFLLSHGLLRVILSRYVDEDPHQLRFEVSAQGKPHLIGRDSRPASVQFSLAHSAECAVGGVARGRAIGVDVEAIRRDVEALALAERFFAPEEARRLNEADGESQRSLFYRYWTAKEAYLKARGVGLSDGLNRFVVRWDSDGLTARIRTLDGEAVQSQWLVRSLALGCHLAGAVAVEGDDWSPHLLEPPANLVVQPQ